MPNIYAACSSDMRAEYCFKVQSAFDALHMIVILKAHALANAARFPPPRRPRPPVIPVLLPAVEEIPTPGDKGTTGHVASALGGATQSDPPAGAAAEAGIRGLENQLASFPSGLYSPAHQQQDFAGGGPSVSAAGLIPQQISAELHLHTEQRCMEQHNAEMHLYEHHQQQQQQAAAAAAQYYGMLAGGDVPTDGTQTNSRVLIDNGVPLA